MNFRLLQRRRALSLVLVALCMSPLCAEIPMIDSLSDTIFVDPLPSAPRLQKLQDTTQAIIPNSYYSSTLPRIVSLLCYNHEVPYKPAFLTLETDTPQDILTDRGKAPYKTEPFALNQFVLGRKIDENTIVQVLMKNFDLLKIPKSELESSRITSTIVEAVDLFLPNAQVPVDSSTDSIPSFNLKRRYWKFAVESNIQFSQNYVSKNWHKGGANSLNLYNRQYFNATYTRDRVSWLNELEWRLSSYTSEADTVSKFRIADDLLRIHSNFGIKAYKDLFYTLDAEVKTSLFTRREENKQEILSALFSPVTFNVGLGMRYLYEWNSESYYGRKLKISVILSPFAYDLRWSFKSSGIDLTRHGFPAGETFYHAFGSTLRIESLFDITPTISWQSRFYYNTSYKRVETEWDNSLNVAISRYFSTRLMVQLRFDDAVPRTPENPSRLQINELLSIGFSYVL